MKLFGKKENNNARPVIKPDKGGSGLLNILAPMALDFRQKHITFGDQYGRILVVANYPQRVGPAWLSRFTSMPGVFLSVHFRPMETDKLLKDINQSVGEFTERLSKGGNHLLTRRTERSLRDADKLMKMIDEEEQNVFLMVTTLLILGSDMEILESRSRKVESALAAAGMKGRAVILRQEDGLRAVGPWGILPEEIIKAGNRPVPAETVAACFPFANSGIKDGSGIVLGRDSNGGIIMIDVWKRGGDRTNSNFTILGKPGTGKSFAVKLKHLREYEQGAKIIQIDPEREYREMCIKLDGSWINCAGGSGRINPLQVRSLPLIDKEDKEEDEIEEASLGPLAIHLQILRTFFTLYLTDLTDIEKAFLEKALVELYNNKGIFWDTDPSKIPNETWPTIKDLYNLILDKSKLDPDTWNRLEVLLERPAVGADAPLWAGPTSVKINSDFIVFDINNLLDAEDCVLSAQYFNVLTYAWHLVVNDRSEKIILGVDEAYLLADKRAPKALQFLRNASKRIRKYKGELDTASQNVIDFFDDSVAMYGKALLNNPSYKLLLGQGEDDLAELTKLLKLSEAEQELLANAKRGEGLLIAGTQRVKVKIEAAPYELEIIGTGGGD